MDDEEGEAGLSVRPGAIVRRLEMLPRAGHRLLAEARQHRHALEDEHANALLIDMQQRNKNRTNLTRPLLAKLHAWLLDYQHIRSCPGRQAVADPRARRQEDRSGAAAAVGSVLHAGLP